MANLVFLVRDTASLRPQAQLLRGQAVGVVTQAGNGHGSDKNAAHTGHADQREEHSSGALWDPGGLGQALSIISLEEAIEREREGRGEKERLSTGNAERAFILTARHSKRRESRGGRSKGRKRLAAAVVTVTPPHP